MSTTFQEDLFTRIDGQLPDEPFFSTVYLSSSTIPADVGHFLTQALIRRATLEASDLVTRQSPWIDFDSTVVAPALDRFLSSISQAARFPRDDFGKSLARAVKYCTGYLEAPVKTLISFAIVDDPNQNQASAVRRRAGYFLYYPSILRTFDEYLGSLNNGTVSREGADSFLRSQVETAAQSLDAGGWNRIFESVFSIYSFTYDGSTTFPSEPFLNILEEHGASGLAGELRAGFQASGDQLDQEQITAQVERFFRPAEPEPVLPAAESDKNSDAELPLWKQFAQADSTTSSTESPIENAPISAEPLWKSYQKDLEGQDEPSTTADRTLNPNQVLGDALEHRDQFIAELFRGDAQLFDKTLNKIASAESWSEASQVLSSDVFRKFQVDIYSDTAVLFTNAIEQRIRQRT